MSQDSLLQFVLNIISEMTQKIKIIPLGAGQQVGRSCIVVKIKDKTIVFDSGIHMQYNDKQKYPDYDFICKDSQGNRIPINDAIDIVIITHFHLDHCGALPYLTQYHKYNGPIFASTPTKAMIPYMLQDFRKVTTDVKKQQKNFYVYTSMQGKASAQKIASLGLRQSITVKGVTITSYYAGHVLGAAMFLVEYQGLSVLYTGDYNSYADRHLSAAYAPRINPNIIITETTYASTIRDTKRDRQRKMLKIVTQTLQRGGKVLIPVFALGRAQQLSVLLQTYWNRTQSNIPVYFSAGLIQKANFYYKLFIQWQNQKIKQDFLQNNTFNFKKVKPFDKSLIRAQFPYVLFATPGMLHGGTSLQVFKQWCGNSKNTLIIPGYCVPGTFGNKLLSGIRNLQIDMKQYQVNMSIENISFSAHADAKGIINLIRHVNAENIVFVHGDKHKMETFAQIVQKQLNRDVYRPQNKQTIEIQCKLRRKIKIQGIKQPKIQGYIFNKDNSYKLIDQQKQLLHELNLMKNLLSKDKNITQNCIVISKNIKTVLQTTQKRAQKLKKIQIPHKRTNQITYQISQSSSQQQQQNYIMKDQKQEYRQYEMMDEMIDQMIDMGKQYKQTLQNRGVKEEDDENNKRIGIKKENDGKFVKVYENLEDMCYKIRKAG